MTIRKLSMKKLIKNTNNLCTMHSAVFGESAVKDFLNDQLNNLLYILYFIQINVFQELKLTQNFYF